MTDEGPDRTFLLGNLVSAYTDAIRVSDYKANLTVLFVAIMMGPAIGYRASYPHFLSTPIIVAPFFVAFVCLLLCVLPRFPKSGRRGFLVLRNAREGDFAVPEDDEDKEIEQLKLTCATLSGILFWKTTFLKVSLYTCLAAIATSMALLLYSLVAGVVR